MTTELKEINNSVDNNLDSTVDNNMDKNSGTENDAEQKATLDNIQELQDMERRLYVNLEVDAASRNPDLTKQEQHINEVNKLSNMRVKLYEQLRDNYRYLSNSVSETRDNLVNQTAVTKIVENELNNAKKKLRTLDDAKYNKLRMVEINTYQAKQTAAYKKMVAVVAMACVPLILITVLYNRDLLNDTLAVSLFLLIVITSALYLGYLGIDLTMRSNMNFDEYEFTFDKSAVSNRINNNSSTKTSDDIGSSGMVVPSCFGETCCSDGTKWSKTEGKCVNNPGENPEESPSAVMGGNPSDGSANGTETSGEKQIANAEMNGPSSNEGFTQLFRPKNNILQSVFNSTKMVGTLEKSNNFVEPYETEKTQFASV